MAKDHSELDELASQVLCYVTRDGYQPVKPRVIAKKLGLPQERHAELKKAVKRLVKQGRLAYGSKHLVKPVVAHGPGIAQRDTHTLTGVFRRALGGYGFVTPRSAGRAYDRSDDIYVPAHKTLDAADGDLVAVRVKPPRGKCDARSRGEIVEVLERETHRFVGLYLEDADSGFVQVDGRVFAQPIAVGDPGAKNASPGDKVVIEMVRFPSHTHDGEGVIVELLGPRGAPGVDTASIIREFALPDAFPLEVLQAARETAAGFDESVGEERQDLTSLTVVTIDPLDARDFDDAISLEREENGHWRLGVHIADVSFFVPANSPLDRDARDRATSVYLPDRVLPMLPEILSNNLASLQPGRVRFTKSVFIEFTPDGAFVSSRVENGAIRSRHRFTYEDVDDYLANREPWRERLGGDVFQLLDRMHQLAMILRRRRLQRGAIELTLPEIRIELNKKGEVQGAHVVEHTESHQIIEEFMLAANEAVARLLNEHELHFLRRVHTPPDPRKLRTLTEFVRELGIPCSNLESRFEINRVIEQAAGRPEERAVNFAVLKSMQKARYSPEPEPHYALHSEHYCHFTSPIRRYPDLTVHRMIDALLRGKRPVADFDHLRLLGEHCSNRERRAENAERELTKVKLLHLLSKRIGRHMDAVITGVERFGIFAEGLELPAEGFLHIDSLHDDFYRHDPRTHSLTGHRQGNAFRLGDVIRVEIAHVDVDRRELGFRLVERKGRAVEKTARSTKSTRKAAEGRPRSEQSPARRKKRSS